VYFIAGWQGLDVSDVLWTQDQPQHLGSTQALLQEKIRQLENEMGEPERRELAKARKRQLKEVSAVLADKSKPSDEKIAFLEQKIVSLV
jgi:hypothetical protein